MTHVASLRSIQKILNDGGWQMFALVFLGVWIGYLLAKRTLELHLVAQNLRALQNIDPGLPLEAKREWHVMEQRLFLQRTPVLRQTVIAAAPLLGLLGTVAGMITTFSSLSDGVWVDSSGGIAGGISQALLTTQLGLVIALPAILWQRLLQQRARRLSVKFERLLSGERP